MAKKMSYLGNEMNFTPIINQILSVAIYLIPLFIIITFLKSAYFKGIVGEFIVNLTAKIFLDKTKYHLLKNITLPTEGLTTQIDHIIVSEYGIFVVETKNMKGWIFGGVHQKNWTQKIFKHTNKFQNPLHQNYKHVKTLGSLLELKPEQIFSVVVFVGDSEFKTKMPENVTYAKGYINYIKSKKQPVLTENEVTTIIQKIESDRLLQSFKTNRKHVKHVKEIIENKNTVQTVNKTCQKCGSEMVEREAKRGKYIGQKFWGCSNFPKCKNIIKVW
jgi:restriction system protein